MKRRRELGLCEVTTKRGEVWSLPRDEYPKVRVAWLKGCRFVDTVDFHGAPTTIKLEEVDGVSDVSADVIQARIEEKRMDEADDDYAGGYA